MRRWLARSWPELVGAAAGAAWFLFIGGGRAVVPTHLAPFAQGDWSQHVLGWLFFRRSRWGLPLGRIDGFAWPAGTTVGFTDANPLLAIPGKVLSPLLPLDFQYVGPWLLACFALQGFFGARLAAAGSPAPAYRALGGALFALAPPLVQRLGHDTLCAHFGLLLLLALNLAPAASPREARRALRAASATTLLLGAVHPYLAVMCLLLTVALAVRLAAVDRLLSRTEVELRACALFVALAGVFALLGYLTSAPSHGPGFGRYGADLLTFVNPMGMSWLLPTLPVHDLAWEGNAYLGLGALALVAGCAALAAARARPSRRALAALAPAAAVALFLACYSVSDAVHVAGREILSLRAIYRPLAGVVGPFRTSGRFVWPLHYLVLGGAVVALPRLVRRPRVATALLGGALALQVVDLAPRAFDFQFHSGGPVGLADPRWELARGRYDHLALVPALIVGGGPPCAGVAWRPGEPWRPLAFEAYRLGLTVNSGYVARGAHRGFAPACVAVERDVAAARLDPRTVYVLHPSVAPAVAAREGVACGALDGFHLCVAASPASALADALRAAPAAAR